MRKYTRWTKEVLEPIVKSSNSYAECLRQMGLREAGGNYKQLQLNIDRFKLDSSHMTHQAHNTGMEFLPLGLLKSKHNIKKRLVKEFGHTCQECGLSEWGSRPIPLELEHIDGDNRNNS